MNKLILGDPKAISKALKKANVPYEIPIAIYTPKYLEFEIFGFS